MPRRPQVVISCEHASNRIPARWKGLGLGSKALRSHIAWDPGARAVARYCARRLHCVYHEGKYSRLLIDLNRGLHNPKLIPKLSFDVPIPGNRDVSYAERSLRIERYYEPYRSVVVEDIRRAIKNGCSCLHVSVHSFTPVLRGRVRKADVGLLYDPSRHSERIWASAFAKSLTGDSLRVRRNYPYRGTSDGLTTFCRRLFSSSLYAGLEIEINQRVLRRRHDISRLSSAVAKAIEAGLTRS